MPRSRTAIAWPWSSTPCVNPAGAANGSPCISRNFRMVSPVGVAWKPQASNGFQHISCGKPGVRLRFRRRRRPAKDCLKSCRVGGVSLLPKIGYTQGRGVWPCTLCHRARRRRFSWRLPACRPCSGPRTTTDTERPRGRPRRATPAPQPRDHATSESHPGLCATCRDWRPPSSSRRRCSSIPRRKSSRPPTKPS